jgi:hypothetical protein
MTPGAIEAEFPGKRMRGYTSTTATWTAGPHKGGRFEMCEGVGGVGPRVLSRSHLVHRQRSALLASAGALHLGEEGQGHLL